MPESDQTRTEAKRGAKIHGSSHSAIRPMPKGIPRRKIESSRHSEDPTSITAADNKSHRCNRNERLNPMRVIIVERRGLPPPVEPPQTIIVSMCEMDSGLRAVNGRQHRLVRPLSVANYPSSQG